MERGTSGLLRRPSRCRSARQPFSRGCGAGSSRLRHHRPWQRRQRAQTRRTKMSRCWTRTRCPARALGRAGVHGRRTRTRRPRRRTVRRKPGAASAVCCRRRTRRRCSRCFRARSCWATRSARYGCRGSGATGARPAGGRRAHSHTSRSTPPHFTQLQALPPPRARLRAMLPRPGAPRRPAQATPRVLMTRGRAHLETATCLVSPLPQRVAGPRAPARRHQ